MTGMEQHCTDAIYCFGCALSAKVPRNLHSSRSKMQGPHKLYTVALQLRPVFVVVPSCVKTVWLLKPNRFHPKVLCYFPAKDGTSPSRVFHEGGLMTIWITHHGATVPPYFSVCFAMYLLRSVSSVYIATTEKCARPKLPHQSSGKSRRGGFVSFTILRLRSRFLQLNPPFPTLRSRQGLPM
jgi:hypothetical protein